jgi:DNA-binding transcriptional MerR regulator
MSDIPIGQLARRSGVKVPTIRYYEQEGLLSTPARTEGGQRRYDEAALARLRFVRHARELGFELQAIRELLTLSTQPDRPCAEVDWIARRQMVEVERRIGQLVALRAELKRMLDECGQGRVCDCRVIEALADSGR